MPHNFSLYKQSLVDWKNSTGRSIGSVPITWTIDDLTLEWIETFSIGEIPEDDNWKTVATEFKLWQEDRYREWGHLKEATKHYMAFEPKLEFDITEIITQIGCSAKEYGYNFLKLPAGRMIPWHCDTYAYCVKKYSVADEEIIRIKRAVIFMQDWSVGQIIQVGKSMLSDWKAGDMYTWDHEAWHGAANFGTEDLIIMQVTYYD